MLLSAQSFVFFLRVSLVGVGNLFEDLSFQVYYIASFLKTSLNMYSFTKILYNRNIYQNWMLDLAFLIHAHCKQWIFVTILYPILNWGICNYFWMQNV